MVSHLPAPSATTIVKFTITSPSTPRPIHHPTLALALALALASLASLPSLLSLSWTPRRRRRPPLPLPSPNYPITEPRIALTLSANLILARQLLVTQATLLLARVVPPAAALIPQPLLRLRVLLLAHTLLLDAALALEDVGVGMVSLAMRQPMSTTLSIPVRVSMMALCRRMS